MAKPIRNPQAGRERHVEIPGEYVKEAAIVPSPTAVAAEALATGVVPLVFSTLPLRFCTTVTKTFPELPGQRARQHARQQGDSDRNQGRGVCHKRPYQCGRKTA